MAQYLEGFTLGGGPFGGIGRQKFGFELNPWAQPEEQPWSMPDISLWDVASAPAKALWNLPEWLGQANEAGKRLFTTEEGATELLHMGTDTSFEPLPPSGIREKIRAGELNYVDYPEYDVAQSIGIGAAEIGAAGAMKYGPKLADEALKMMTFGEISGRDVLGHTPQFINDLNRRLGLPEMPFEMPVTGYHYGRTKGLTELDPAYHGEGAMGRERQYSKFMDKDLWPTYFYLDEGMGVKPESVVLSGAKSVYKADLPDDLMYDMLSDPDGLWMAAKEQVRMPGGNAPASEAMPLFLRSLKDKGYKGYIGHNPNIPDQGVGAVLGKTPVEELPAGVGMSRQGVYPDPDAGYNVLAGDNVIKMVQSKRAKSAGEEVVWIDMDKLDESWMQDSGFYLPFSGGNRIGTRYEDLQAKLPGLKDLDMPEAGFRDNGIFSFTDGRHRTALLRDKGANRIPVSMTKEDAKIARDMGFEAPRDKWFRGTWTPDETFDDPRRAAGHWTRSESYAKDYGDHMVTAGISAKNPKMIADEDWRMLNEPEMAHKVSQLRRQGYDAAISDSTGDIIPLYPEQVKRRGVSQTGEQEPLVTAENLKDLGVDIPPAPEIKALPNPARTRQRNREITQERWDALAAATKGAGVKRGKVKGGDPIEGPVRPDDKPLGKTPKTGGRYVGAGPDVTSPQKKTSLVNEYIRRVKKALAGGIPRGYFYEGGRNTLESITPDVEHWRLMSELMEPTSTQVGPYQNLNYAITAHDQYRMGVPPKVGIYPNNLRPSVESALWDDQAFTGYKVKRYGNLLGPDWNSANLDELAKMPPNDMWEGFGTGLGLDAKGKKKVPSGPTQVAFSDHIRESARRRLNDELIAAGEQPLTSAEMQELHWLVIRAENEGRPLQLGPKDTLGGSLPSFTAQHSWEPKPTPDAGININMPMGEYSDEVVDIILDKAGKDRFIYAGGGDLQLQAIRGTGVYKGDTTPGVQSRSMVGKTEGGGMDPASKKRLEFTETMRQFALGQQARAAHVPLSVDSRKAARMFEIKLGRQLSSDEMADLDTLINTLVSPAGENPWVMKNAGRNVPIDTEDGVRLMDVTGMTKSGGRGDIKKAGFGDEMTRIEDEIKAITGGGELSPREYDSIYGEFDWAGGGVTEDLLKVIDDPDYPNIKRLADSPQTRELMGDIAGMYKRLEAEGKLTPNQKLVDVLDAWATSGLQGVRQLVKKGLAPAVVLSILGGRSQQSPLSADQGA